MSVLESGRIYRFDRVVGVIVEGCMCCIVDSNDMI